MRVLLVEDDPTTSKSIELMLTHANLNVYTTDMGEEGIDGNRVDVQAFTKALFSYDRFANVIDILEIAKV